MNDDDVTWLREWLIGLPVSCLRLAKRFPPLAQVTATMSLVVPGAAGPGIVASYYEPDDEHLEGMVGVVGPSSLGWVKAPVDPAVLVLDSTKDVHPDVIQAIDDLLLEHEQMIN